MERDLIQEKVMAAARNVARAPYTDISMDMPMECVATDSLDQTCLTFELEDALKIDISGPELFDGIKTLGDLVEKMRTLVTEATPS